MVSPSDVTSSVSVASVASSRSESIVYLASSLGIETGGARGRGGSVAARVAARGGTRATAVHGGASCGRAGSIVTVVGAGAHTVVRELVVGRYTAVGRRCSSRSCGVVREVCRVAAELGSRLRTVGSCALGWGVVLRLSGLARDSRRG